MKFKVELYAEIEVDGDTVDAAVEAAFKHLAGVPDLSDVLFASAEEVTSCKFCGCTDENACPGGCGWINAEHTVCSAEICRSKYQDEVIAVFAANNSL